jgi:hypothetical protein
MTAPNWLPSKSEIDAAIARQREERLRMAQRVCDGPQTILMPKGGLLSQRTAYLPPPQEVKGVDKPARDWLAIAAWITIAAVWSAFSVFVYLAFTGGAK